LTKVAAFDRVATSGTFDICLGGDNEPGASVLNQAYTWTGINDFVEIELTEAIDPEGQNVWIVFNTNDGTNYPAAECADTGDADGRWIYLASDGWFDVTEAGIPCTWMLRGYFEEVEQPEDEDYAIAEVLGVIIYRNGEVITSKPVAGESYSDIKGGTHDEYCVRVVYGGELALRVLACLVRAVVLYGGRDDHAVDVDLVAEQMLVFVYCACVRLAHKRASAKRTHGTQVLAPASDDNAAFCPAKMCIGSYGVMIFFRDEIALSKAFEFRFERFLE
jgi:hypothetical protein